MPPIPVAFVLHDAIEVDDDDDDDTGGGAGGGTLGFVTPAGVAGGSGMLTSGGGTVIC